MHTKEYIKTGVEGLDQLFDSGIPQGSAVLLSGGAGSGKTLLSLQMLHYHARKGKTCVYMSFEESKEKLFSHMNDFRWNPEDLEKKGSLIIQRFSPLDIARSVDALLMKVKGELLIDVDPIILPDGVKPDFVVVDSLTAVASAFTGQEDSYRIYIEQLFRFFEELGCTSFLISETTDASKLSQTGVEEFLADAVIVLHANKRGNVREKAVEVLKLRGAKHQKKIVAMDITKSGIEIYPDQEVFSEIN